MLCKYCSLKCVHITSRNIFLFSSNISVSNSILLAFKAYLVREFVMVVVLSIFEDWEICLEYSAVEMSVSSTKQNKNISDSGHKNHMKIVSHG